MEHAYTLYKQSSFNVEWSFSREELLTCGTVSLTLLVLPVFLPLKGLLEQPILANILTVMRLIT